MKELLFLLHKIGIVNDGKMKTRANRNNGQHGGQELPGVFVNTCNAVHYPPPNKFLKHKGTAAPADPGLHRELACERAFNKNCYDKKFRKQIN